MKVLARMARYMAKLHRLNLLERGLAHIADSKYQRSAELTVQV